MGWAGNLLIYPGNNKVSGTEGFATPRAIRLFHERNEEGKSYTFLTDSQAAGIVFDTTGTGRLKPWQGL